MKIYHIVLNAEYTTKKFQNNLLAQKLAKAINQTGVCGQVSFNGTNNIHVLVSNQFRQTVFDIVVNGDQVRLTKNNQEIAKYTVHDYHFDRDLLVNYLEGSLNRIPWFNYQLAI